MPALPELSLSLLTTFDNLKPSARGLLGLPSASSAIDPCDSREAYVSVYLKGVCVTLRAHNGQDIREPPLLIMARSIDGESRFGACAEEFSPCRLRQQFLAEQNSSSRPPRRAFPGL